MTPKRRKKLIFGTTVVAVGLALSSVASACIVQKGKLTVSVDPTGSGRADGDTVIGAGTSHGWCQKATNSAAAFEGDAIDYVVAPTVSGDCNFSTTNRLANGTYEVRVYNPDGVGTGDEYPYRNDTGSGKWEFTDGTGCYRFDIRRGDVQGEMTISSGAGSLLNDALDLPSTPPNRNGTNDASLVCVAPTNGNPNNAPGIFSPLRVLTV